MKKALVPNVFYVGMDDKDIDLFEGQLIVPNGVAYNSYVITDEKIAIMDMVDRRKGEEWLAKVKEVLCGRQPDYLVMSHMEPDHSANLVEVLENFPQMKIVATAQLFRMLPNFFPVDISERCITVGEGDTLSLGQHTLQFVMAPMVHWPEVMLSYEQTEQILFSADAFGKFGTLDTKEDWACEARRYYFNIVGKFGQMVQNLLKKLADVPVKMICPLHGPILSDNLSYYIDKYRTWSSYEPEDKGIFIAYASLHGNTAKAALRLKEILEEKGAEKVAITDLARDDMAEAVEDAFRYDRMVLAAPTYEMSIMPVMADFLSHLKHKQYQKRKVAIIENGSWAPVSGKLMKEQLASMAQIDLVDEMVTIRSAFKESDEAALRRLADQLI